MKMICWSHTFLLQYEIKQSDVWAVHTCVWTIQKTPKNVQNSFDIHMHWATHTIEILLRALKLQMKVKTRCRHLQQRREFFSVPS